MPVKYGQFFDFRNNPVFCNMIDQQTQGLERKKNGWFWLGGGLLLSVVFTIGWIESQSNVVLTRAALIAPLTPAWHIHAKDPSIEALIVKWRDSMDFNGTLLYAEKGRIVHIGAYGYADEDRQIPITPETEFQLASVSKMFTAFAVLTLVDDGKIGLDTPVQEYLSAFPYPEVTVRHLLNHRSGMSRYEYLLEGHKDDLVASSNAAVLGLLAADPPPLWFNPGERFNYSNVNYALLALIVEQVSGSSFPDFLQQRIFRPLGMTHTYVFDRNQQPWPEHMAWGYKHNRKGYYAVPADFLDGVFGDKGLHSTVLDLFKFDQALYARKLLSANTYHDLLDFSEETENPMYYNLGWRLEKGWNGLMYHQGWWMGFRTCFIRDREKEITLIALTNRDHLRNPMNFFGLYGEIMSLKGEKSFDPQVEQEGSSSAPTR